MSDSRQWLSPEGNFLFGKHEGYSVEYVSTIDHSYIKWIVDAVEDICDEDREILESHLMFRKRGKA